MGLHGCLGEQPATVHLPVSGPVIPSVHPRTHWSPACSALFTEFVTEEIATYGYLAIFVLMVLESACVPIRAR